MQELIIKKDLTPEIFINNDVDSVVEDIKKKVSEFKSDVSSNNGREELRSFAYKISRSKTALDELGKELVSKWKEQAKLVDAKRKLMRDELDLLKDETRKPLTDWENAEKERKEKHKYDIDHIKNIANQCAQYWDTMSSDALMNYKQEVGSFKAKKWEEFTKEYEEVSENSLKQIEDAIQKQKNRDREQAELEQLRKEKVERDKEKQEEAIKKEAAEKARLEAEIKAEQEARKKEAEANAAQAKLEQEKLRIVQEKEAAERKVKEHKERLKQAKEFAKKAMETAVKEEKERIEAEQEAKQQAELKRKADEEHKNKILSEIRKAFRESTISPEYADVITQLLFKGKIPHVTIKF